MFDNKFPSEMTYYAIIPVFLVLMLSLIITIFMKRDTDGEKLRFHYIVELCFMIGIGLTLPLIFGYTIWIVKSFWIREIFFENIIYVILMVFLTLCLLTIIIWLYLRLLVMLEKIKLQEKEI